MTTLFSKAIFSLSCFRTRTEPIFRRTEQNKTDFSELDHIAKELFSNRKDYPNWSVKFQPGQISQITKSCGNTGNKTSRHLDNTIVCRFYLAEMKQRLFRLDYLIEVAFQQLFGSSLSKSSTCSNSLAKKLISAKT